MTFVHWGLLWLLPLAVLPILLHLLTLFRLRTVELSTFRFLFDSYMHQRRRMRFLEALLAMLRTLFLIGLILAFSKPLVKHWNNLFLSGAGGRDVILLVDCSASMKAQTTGQSALKRARDAAQAVAGRLGPEDRVTLVRVASRPEVVFSRFSSDAKTIADSILGLALTPSRANFYEAFQKVFNPEGPKRNSPVVYVFTDCQASGWAEVRRQRIDSILPADARLVVVNVGSREAIPNQAVVGDAPPRRRAVVGLPLRLTARVANHSPRPAQLTLSTFIDEQEIARHSLALKPGETVTRRVLYTPAKEGVHRGRFAITGNTDDHFPDDDSYLFTVTAVPKIRVLVVNGNPSPDPNLDETFYLRAVSEIFAEAPEEKSLARDPARLGTLREIARSLELKQVPESGLNDPALRDAGVVVLANCGNLNDQQFGELREFVSAGGGLLIFPGDRVRPEVYNTRFFPIPGVPGLALTPVRIGEPLGDPGKYESYGRLSDLNWSHPVLGIFDDPQRDVPYFQNVLFYRRFPLTVPDAKAKYEWLARFSSKSFALAQNRYGDGLVVVAGFPLNRRWSNLPTENGKEFVPLMLRLLGYAQRRADLEVPTAVAPGDVAEISAASSWAPADCLVTDPEGNPARVALERSGSRLVGGFEATQSRGYYQVEVRPKQGDADSARLDFAVNLSPEESDFRTLDEKGFQSFLPANQLTFVDASGEAQQVQSVFYDLEEHLFGWVIYLMFVVIGVEFFLATLGGRKRPTGEEAAEPDRVHEARAGGWIGRISGAGGK